MPDGALVVELRLADRGHAGQALHAVEDLLRRLRVAVDVDDDRDRAVEARPEALGQQVVGPPAGLGGRLRALVGGPEAHEQRRRRQREDQHEDDGEHDLRVRGHEAAPAGDGRPLARRLGVVQRAHERDLQPVDLVAEERQHGRQQGVRDQHRGEHAEGAADAELGDEVEPDERQAGHRDRDREAGEEHGAAGGRACLGGRIARREPVVEELSEARDDEQRVVDADAQPDHRDEDRRDRVDVGQAGEDVEEQERRHQRAVSAARSGSASP